MLEAVERLILLLKSNNFIIQRYDSYSTDSIYLKLDYGMCNSIRISNHKGKKHLNYMYNLVLDGCNSYYIKNTDGKYTRHYYSLDNMDLLISHILENRTEKLLKYKTSGYNYLMERNRLNNDSKQGFWEKSRLV